MLSAQPFVTIADSASAAPNLALWHSRRSLREAFPDYLSDGLIVIACAACNEAVYAIKERIIAHSFSGNCTQAYGDLSRSDLSKSGCSLFLPLWKIKIEEIIDPIDITENLCFRYQIYQALVSV